MTVSNPRAEAARTPLVGLSSAELAQIVQDLGERSYRGRQLSHWIYQRRATLIDQMTDLPKALRARLSERHDVGRSEVVHRSASSDGAVKYLLGLRDGETIETVYLPYPDRVSVCLSSQVGCPAGCAFCATAQGGLVRNLTAGEIVDQVLTLASEQPNRRISHAVFMGMGEPLLNVENVLRALQLLTDEVGMSARHLTVSTVGVPEGIRRLAQEAPNVTLALSLHAPDDELRARLVPTARKWSIAEILDACRRHYEQTRRNLTFEYILLRGVNDAPAHAARLAQILGDLPGNVNLIPFNQVSTASDFRRPDAARIAAFRDALESAGRPTTQRMERGHDIDAACGQLRRSRLARSAVAATH